MLYFSGLREGESALEVTDLELSTRAGEAILVEPVDGRIVVSTEAVENEGASIPIQDSDLLVPIPTIIPTVAPTPTEVDLTGQGEDALTANAAGDQNGSEDAVQSVESSEGSDASGAGFSLVAHWWIVLIVVALVIGFGIYLGVTRK